MDAIFMYITIDFDAYIYEYKSCIHGYKLGIYKGSSSYNIVLCKLPNLHATIIIIFRSDPFQCEDNYIIEARAKPGRMIGVQLLCMIRIRLYAQHPITRSTDAPPPALG